MRMTGLTSRYLHSCPTNKKVILYTNGTSRAPLPCLAGNAIYKWYPKDTSTMSGRQCYIQMVPQGHLSHVWQAMLYISGTSRAPLPCLGGNVIYKWYLKDTSTMSGRQCYIQVVPQGHLYHVWQAMLYTSGTSRTPLSCLAGNVIYKWYLKGTYTMSGRQCYICTLRAFFVIFAKRFHK